MNEIQIVTITALSIYMISGLFIASVNQLKGELNLSERRLEFERNRKPPVSNNVFNFNGAESMPGDHFVWTGDELLRLAPEPLVLPDLVDGSVVTVIGDK